MKLTNKILAVLLAMTLITNQGLAWDDEQKQDENSKRKYVIAGLVTAGVVVAGVVGFKAWKYFDVGKMFKKQAVDQKEYIGIDLGTSKSGGGRGDELIPDEHGKTMTASAVLFDKDGKAVKTGDTVIEEDGVITSAKRVIGTSYNRAKEDNTLKVVKDIREDKGHMAAIETAAGKTVSPEEVATEVLRGVKNRIDTHYGKDFEKAVITVPAYFYDFQKAATKRAAEAAGFKKVVLINEPTAAAFAHGAAELDIKKLKDGVNYLVYDFGGGTMDVSIVTAKIEKKQRTFKVTSIAGNPRLGGDDIDKKIAEKFAEDLGISDFDSASDKTKSILRRQAEEAKIHLSDANNEVYKSKFELEGKEVEVEVGIDAFNQEITSIIDETIDLTQKAIDEAPNLNIENIDEVVLVGGSSRNRLARQKLIEMFGEARLQKSLDGEIDPDEMVAKGAAKYAKVLDEQSDAYHLSDIVPISLRVDIRQGGKNGKLVSEVVIPKFADTPAKGTQGGSSLGNMVEIVVRQGESGIPEENVKLGSVKLAGEKEGEAIDINYAIDENGILEVTAKNLDTNTEETKIIDMSATPEEIDEVVEEGTEQAQQQSEKFFQQLLEGGLSEEVVEQLQKNQEEMKELLNKVLKDNEVTRAELSEIKELLAKKAEAN